MDLLPCTQGVKIKPVTMATNKAASLDEELGDITGYEFGEPITAVDYIILTSYQLQRSMRQRKEKLWWV